MTTIRFNAITYSHKLSDAGLDKKIADVQAEEMSAIINNDLSTKNDLKDLENRLENKIIIKLGAIVISCTGVLAILIGILGFVLRK